MSARSIVKRPSAWQWASALLLAMLFAMPAHAAVQEIRLTAAGVDPSPDRSQQLAVDYAKKRAVYLVLLKLKVPNPIVKAESLTPEQMAQVIRGTTVLQTKRIDETTYADVSVSVVDEILLRVLEIDTQVNAVSLEKTSVTEGVLVIPVYAKHDRPYVWEKENILHDSMAASALKISHGAVVVPTGDYEDLRLIDQHNVLTVKVGELEPMMKRYGVREIIIAVVPEEKRGSDQPMIVLLRRLSVKLSRNEQITIPPPIATESVEDRIDEVTTEVANAATQIATSTSAQEQAAMKNAPQVPIYFYYGSMREIGQMQESMRATEGVLALSIPTIALNNIHGVLYLTADKEVVKRALTKKGLIVTDHDDGWQVSLR